MITIFCFLQKVQNGLPFGIKFANVFSLIRAISFAIPFNNHCSMVGIAKSFQHWHTETLLLLSYKRIKHAIFPNFCLFIVKNVSGLNCILTFQVFCSFLSQLYYFQRCSRKKYLCLRCLCISLYLRVNPHNS